MRLFVILAGSESKITCSVEDNYISWYLFRKLMALWKDFVIFRLSITAQFRDFSKIGSVEPKKRHFISNPNLWFFHYTHCFRYLHVLSILMCFATALVSRPFPSHRLCTFDIAACFQTLLLYINLLPVKFFRRSLASLQTPRVFNDLAKFQYAICCFCGKEKLCKGWGRSDSAGSCSSLQVFVSRAYYYRLIIISNK